MFGFKERPAKSGVDASLNAVNVNNNGSVQSTLLKITKDTDIDKLTDEEIKNSANYWIKREEIAYKKYLTIYTIALMGIFVLLFLILSIMSFASGDPTGIISLIGALILAGFTVYVVFIEFRKKVDERIDRSICKKCGQLLLRNRNIINIVELSRQQKIKDDNSMTITAKIQYQTYCDNCHDVETFTFSGRIYSRYYDKDGKLHEVYTSPEKLARCQLLGPDELSEKPGLLEKFLAKTLGKKLEKDTIKAIREEFDKSEAAQKKREEKERKRLAKVAKRAEKRRQKELKKGIKPEETQNPNLPPIMPQNNAEAQNPGLNQSSGEIPQANNQGVAGDSAPQNVAQAPARRRNRGVPFFIVGIISAGISLFTSITGLSTIATYVIGKESGYGPVEPASFQNITTVTAVMTLVLAAIGIVFAIIAKTKKFRVFFIPIILGSLAIVLGVAVLVISGFAFK